MRRTIVGLVVCALVCVTVAAYAIEPSSFRPGEYEALKKQAAQSLAAKKAKAAAQEAYINNLKLSIEQDRREAAYYFGQARIHAAAAAQHRANSAAIRADIIASQPYSVYVRPMGINRYLIIPNR